MSTSEELDSKDISDYVNFPDVIVVNDICIIWMVRYCLERGSDSISLHECFRMLLNNWERLDPATRNLIANEIRFRIDNAYFMLREDKVSWNMILEKHDER